MIFLALALLLQDPAPIDPKPLDQAVRSIPGFNALKPGRPADDEAFLRRLTLDLENRAATPQELQAFGLGAAADKRAVKIDELLASDRFAEVWGERLARLLIGEPAAFRAGGLPRLPAGYGPKLGRLFADWMIEQVKKDRPWTEIVREILEARGDPARNPAAVYKVSFGGRPEEAALGIARHFTGIRLACARCHDHPYDKWTVDNVYSLAAFAVREKLEVRTAGGAFDRLEIEVAATGEQEILNLQAAARKDAGVRLGDGGTAKPNWLFGGQAGGADDRMKSLAAFLTARNNPQFPRALVNRVWGWLLGSAILEPADDFNLRNRPLSPSLLEGLTRSWIDHHYTLKPLVRAICLTEIYQREETPLAVEGRVAVWRGALSRDPRPAWIRPLAKPAAPAVVFDAPREWVRVAGIHGFKVHFRVPPRGGEGVEADLGLIEPADAKTPFETLVKDWSLQIPKGKAAARKIAGKGAIDLREVAGEFSCSRDVDGPEPWILLAASVGTPAGPCIVRLSGPRATVEGWREEFETLLKELQPK